VAILSALSFHALAEITGFLARYRKTLLVTGYRKRGDKKRNVI